MTQAMAEVTQPPFFPHVQGSVSSFPKLNNELEIYFAYCIELSSQFGGFLQRWSPRCAFLEPETWKPVLVAQSVFMIYIWFLFVTF